MPAIFVCEHNRYAESTPAKQHLPLEDMSKRAEAYDMASMTVDGQDVEAVYETARRALKHARDGKGPVFVVADCVRLSGHYVGDPQVYRPKEEILELRKTRDPIELLRARLELADEQFDEMDREATRIAEDSVEFAKKGTDPKPEDALKNVYA